LAVATLTAPFSGKQGNVGERTCVTLRRGTAYGARADPPDGAITQFRKSFLVLFFKKELLLL
jgi:hypothetical protein